MVLKAFDKSTKIPKKYFFHHSIHIFHQLALKVQGRLNDQLYKQSLFLKNYLIFSTVSKTPIIYNTF